MMRVSIRTRALVSMVVGFCLGCSPDEGGTLCTERNSEEAGLASETTLRRGSAQLLHFTSPYVLCERATPFRPAILLTVTDPDGAESDVVLQGDAVVAKVGQPLAGDFHFEPTRRGWWVIKATFEPLLGRRQHDVFVHDEIPTAAIAASVTRTFPIECVRAWRTESGSDLCLGEQSLAFSPRGAPTSELAQAVSVGVFGDVIWSLQSTAQGYRLSRAEKTLSPSTSLVLEGAVGARIVFVDETHAAVQSTGGLNFVRYDTGTFELALEWSRRSWELVFPDGEQWWGIARGNRGEPLLCQVTDTALSACVRVDERASFAGLDEHGLWLTGDRVLHVIRRPFETGKVSSERMPKGLGAAMSERPTIAGLLPPVFTFGDSHAIASPDGELWPVAVKLGPVLTSTPTWLALHTARKSTIQYVKRSELR